MKKAQFFYLLRRGFFAGGGGEWSTLVNAFKTRVLADGGTLESESCIRDDVKYLIQNPEPVPTPAFTGLLNDYSGAAAAYSLRLLDNTYTGDAIVVRRASDNTTQAIGFVNNELDTTSLESFCSGTDGFVTTWYDQSGNGVDATQASASSQPKIVSSGSTILVNSKPSFVSDEDYLVNLTKTASSTATMFMVHKGNSDNSSNVSVAGFPANSYVAHIGLYFWEGDSQDPFGFNIWQGDSWGYDNAKTDFDSQSLWTGLFKEGSITTSGVKLFRNGTEKTLSQTRGSSSVNRIIDDGVYIGRGGSIGNSQEGDGWYQEIVIWDADYSSTNRSGIETNINDFYTIY